MRQNGLSDKNIAIHELQQLFNKMPNVCDKKAAEIWRKLGPFDLLKVINEHHLDFDEQLRVH